MGLLDKLLGRSKQPAAAAGTSVACVHTALVPRWDSAADIGKDDLATSFVCDACHQSFSPGEAQALRRTESQRLAAELDLEASREA